MLGQDERVRLARLQQPARRQAVSELAIFVRERGVGRFAQQARAELELTLRGKAASAARHDDLALDQLSEQLVAARALAAAHQQQRAIPEEALTEHARSA